MDCYKQSTNFTAIEPIRKSFEGRYVLVTTNKTLYNVRVEADKVLSKFKHQPHHISYVPSLSGTFLYHL